MSKRSSSVTKTNDLSSENSAKISDIDFKNDLDRKMKKKKNKKKNN